MACRCCAIPRPGIPDVRSCVHSKTVRIHASTLITILRNNIEVPILFWIFEYSKSILTFCPEDILFSESPSKDRRGKPSTHRGVIHVVMSTSEGVCPWLKYLTPSGTMVTRGNPERAAPGRAWGSAAPVQPESADPAARSAEASD